MLFPGALLLPLLMRQPLSAGFERHACRALLAGIAVLYLAVTAWHWQRYQAEVGQLDAVLDRVPAGQRLIGLTSGRSRLFDVPVFDHLGAYYLIGKGGLYASNFFSVGVALKPRWRYFLRRGQQSVGFLRHFHYVLLREPGKRGPHPIHLAPAHWFTKVYGDARWELYRTRRVLDPPRLRPGPDR